MDNVTGSATNWTYEKDGEKKKVPQNKEVIKNKESLTVKAEITKLETIKKELESKYTNQGNKELYDSIINISMTINSLLRV